MRPWRSSGRSGCSCFTIHSQKITKEKSITNEELNTQLYQKMFYEQEQFREWLLGQPPEEILNHCYTYTVREDILLALETNDLSDRQCQALLKSHTPLEDVFREFEHRESDYMENVFDAMCSRADEVIRREKHKEAAR